MSAQASTPYFGSAFSEPGTQINCSDFDNGGSGDAYSVSHPVPQGQNTSYRNTPVPMNTANAGTYGGSGYIVGISNVSGDYLYPGDWVVYTTSFNGGGLYDITLDVATASTGRYAHIEVDGVNVTGSIALPGTADWGTYATATAHAIAISNGTHVIKLEMDSPVGLTNFNWIQFAAHASHTYYVSNSGNDGNNGTSASTPWQTVAKVNSTILGPGDSVLFQRGGVWHEALTSSSSGNVSAPITFADYGTGNKPMFTGGDTLANASFVPVAGYSNVYTINDSTTVNSVLENQVFLQSGNPESAPNTWSYSNGVLMISTSPGDDPRTDGATFTACTRVNEIYTNGYNYITYTNLDAEDTALFGDGYCVRTMGSIGITYNTCDAYYGGKHNFGCINSTQVTYNGCTASYAEPGQGIGGATMFVSYSDTDPAGLSSSSSTYNNCTATHMEDTSSPGNYYPAFTCHGAQLGQTTFNNFTTTYGAFTVLQDSGASNEKVNFNGGTINSADFEVYGTSSMVTNGTTFTGDSALDIYSTGDTFQNCKMQDLLFTNGGQTGYNSAIVVRSGATGNIFRFNTIVYDPTAALNWPMMTLVATGSHTNYYGNIFIGAGSGALMVAPFYFTPSSADVGYADYNFFSASPTFNYSPTESLAQWQSATGADLHSLTGNPSFVSQSGNNYNLNTGSPAINAAPIPSAWLSGTPAITTDFNGNPRPVGSTYDMGAFEYQGPPAAPVITSPTTASGTTGVAFSYQITASNGPTSYSETGTLPTGLTLNTSTGLISGTPSATGSSTVTIKATNATGTGTASLTITITAPQKPVITSATTAGGTVGVAFSYTITANYSPTSFGASGLPAGLSVNTSTGLISGTPTTSGTTPATISASNAAGTGSATLTITIANPPKPVITSAASIGGSVNAAFSYQITASNNPTSFGATNLPAGLSVNTSTGLITGTPTTTGATSATISASNAGGTGSATLTITISQGATLTGSVAANPGGTINLTSIGTDDWSDWGLSGVAQNHKSVSGSAVGHISDEFGIGQGTYQSTGDPIGFSWSDGTPTASATTTNGIQNSGGGNGIGFTVPADTTLRTLTIYAGTDGGAIGDMRATISDGSSPDYDDQSLNNSWGVYTIKYAARSAGQTLTIKFKVANNGGHVYLPAATLAVSGGGGPVAPVITSSTSASGTVGTAFTYTITASNSPTSFSATGLPAGLSVNTSTGVISGTPSASGSTNATISATNSAGTGSATLAITINAAPQPPVITSSTTASGTVGSAFSYTITATNSPTSYSETGTLPGGLSLSTSTGVISGTLTAVGSFPVTIKATNAAGTGSSSLTITISNPPAPVITSSTTASGTVGTSFSYTITGTNSPTSYSESGTLPGGLSLNTSTGVISGTPTAAGSFLVTIKATNAGGTGSASLTITISAGSSGPTLTGSLGSLPSSVNLTTVGIDDWSQWGYSGISQNHKSVSGTAVGMISDEFGVGQGVSESTGDPISCTWSDGTPTVSATTSNGIYNAGGGNGIGFTVPADTTLRTLIIYAGADSGAIGDMRASLSDGSAADYVDDSLSNSWGVYTIQYEARSAGQTLTIKFKIANNGGHVYIPAAALHH